MVGDPRTDEVQHQFLGLVTKKLPNGADNPSYDDVDVDGTQGRPRRRRARATSATPTPARDKTMRLAQDAHARPRPDDVRRAPTTASRRSSWPSTPARCSSTSACSRKPQTGNCRAGRRARRSARPRLLRRRRAAGLPQPRRAATRRRRGLQQVAAADEAATVQRSATRSSRSRTPTTGPTTASPRTGRSSTARTPRPRPATSRTAPDSTADMAHPTRTGDLVVFAYPPYQFDAATPGTLIALSAFFGQHGYVPDVQDLRSNTNMRATFLAGGDAIERGEVDDVRSIDLAPTAAFLLGVPAPQHSQGVVRRDLLDDGRDYTPVNIVGLNDFHGQLEPSDVRPTTRSPTCRSAARAQLATLFDEERAQLPGRHAAAVRRRQRRRLAAELVAARGHADDRRPERVEPGRDGVRQPRVRLRPDADPQAAGARRTSTGCRRTSSRPRPASRRRT